MSIHGLIHHAKTQGNLLEIEPFRGLTALRRILLAAEARGLAEGPWTEVVEGWTEQEWQDRCGSLQEDFDWFLNGKRITVALDPSTDDDDCFLKRLYPIENEVWTIRSRVPSPGIRVFGSFAETNIFIATNWALRADLGQFGSDEWNAAIADSQARWTLLFGEQQERKRGNLNDYISREAISLDAVR